MKSRLGKADSIFKKTEKTKGAAPAGRPGQAIVHPPISPSIENKLTVILPPEQVDFLDRLCLEIRSKTRKKMKRTEIIRALIAGLIGSGLDLSTYGMEEDIAAVIKDRLKD